MSGVGDIIGVLVFIVPVVILACIAYLVAWAARRGWQGGRRKE